MPLYNWQNKTGGSPVEYFTQVNPAPLQSYVNRMVSKKMREKTDVLILESMHERRERTDMREMNQRLDRIEKAILEGNYSRREHQTLDVDIEVNDRELFDRIEIKRQERMKFA